MLLSTNKVKYPNWNFIKKWASLQRIIVSRRVSSIFVQENFNVKHMLRPQQDLLCRYKSFGEFKSKKAEFNFATFLHSSAFKNMKQNEAVKTAIPSQR